MHLILTKHTLLIRSLIACNAPPYNAPPCNAPPCIGLSIVQHRESTKMLQAKPLQSLSSREALYGIFNANQRLSLSIYRLLTKHRKIVHFHLKLSNSNIMRLATGIEFAVAPPKHGSYYTNNKLHSRHNQHNNKQSSIIISKVSMLNTWFSAPQRASHSLVMLSNS